MFPKNPFENKSQPKLDFHKNPLFEPITPQQEVKIVGGVPQNALPDGVKPTNWVEKLETLKRLTLQVNPTTLNPNSTKTLS